MVTQEELNRLFARVILADTTRSDSLTEEERDTLRNIR